MFSLEFPTYGASDVHWKRPLSQASSQGGTDDGDSMSRLDAWKKTTRKLTGDIGVTFYDMHCGAYDQHLDKMSIEDHKDPSTVDWWR